MCTTRLTEDYLIIDPHVTSDEQDGQTLLREWDSSPQPIQGFPNITILNQDNSLEIYAPKEYSQDACFIISQIYALINK